MSFFNKIFGSNEEEINPTKWINLTSAEALENAYEVSKTKPVVLFKHSTRCFISRSVLTRFERQMEEDGSDAADFYFLDLLAFRDLSNKISADFNIQHQSPQLIVVKNGEAVYHNSHDGIDFSSVKKYL